MGSQIDTNYTHQTTCPYCGYEDNAKSEGISDVFKGLIIFCAICLGFYFYYNRKFSKYKRGYRYD